MYDRIRVYKIIDAVVLRALFEIIYFVETLQLPNTYLNDLYATNDTDVFIFLARKSLKFSRKLLPSPKIMFIGLIKPIMIR